MKAKTVMIVGGGAAGLAAAVFCAERLGGERVTLLETAPRVGKKLLATGNGTCNISNQNAAPCHYHGADALSFTAPALEAFPPLAAIDFFDRIGVVCAPRENGRYYPVCEQAAAVLDCLRLTLSHYGVTVRCDAPVTAISREKDGFSLKIGEETLYADVIILATGGAASPSLGGSDKAYALPLSLGHTRTPLFPSIVQVKTDTAFIKAMKGLRTDATVSFCQNGKRVACERGELLFTEYGISGPVVMNISRVVGDWERRKKETMTAVIDLLPAYTEPRLARMLRFRSKQWDRTGEDFFTGLLHKRIGQTVCRAAGFSLTQPMGDLSDQQIDTLVNTVKAFTVSVCGTQGFFGAQVTAGGISTSEVDPATMMSRRVKGLYLIGELLDVDGDCGGYNLQWAWSSAYTAATAIAEAFS